MARKQRYPQLALLARMIAGVGYLAIAISVILGSGAAYLAWQKNEMPMLLGGVVWGLAGLFYGILMLAAAQLIRLLMDIERNTRREGSTAAELSDGQAPLAQPR